MSRGLLGASKRSSALTIPSLVGVERRLGSATSASAFTTTSTTYVDVTLMTVVAVHTRSGFVRYLFHGPSCRASSAGAYLGVKLLQDGSGIDQDFLLSSAANEWGSMMMADVIYLPAGTYTFKVQVASSVGTSTAAINDNSLGKTTLAIWEDVA